MIDLIKPYLSAAAGVLLLAALGYTHAKAYTSGEANIQAKFDTYKEHINEQVSKATIEAARIAKMQDDKYQRARADYADSARDLAGVLNRLRDGTFVLRDGTVQIPECSGGTVPSEAGDPCGIDTTVTARERACQGSQFYADALRDTLQCSKLIDLVK